MLRALLTLVFLLASLPYARAIGVWDDTQRADLICVATFDSMRPVESQSLRADRSLTTYAVKMNVSQVWKGTWTEPQLALYFVREMNGVFNGPFVPPSPFEKNRNYLIMAKRGPDGRFLQSPDDPGGERSFVGSILIREPVAAEADQTVALRMARQLIANLLDADLKIQKVGLDELGSYEDVFTEGENAGKKQSSPAEVAAVKSLLEKEAIPEILRLSRGNDQELSLGALETASWLQQTSIIPQLAQRAQKNAPGAYEMAWALYHFHNREALPLLRAQLGNTNPNARVAIIEAFEEFKDPSVTPDLKRLATDPDSAVRKRAQYALALLGG